MRTRLTSRPWFGPKKNIGWGWRITSWEGLLTTVIFALALVMISLFWRDSRLFPIAMLVVLYVVVVLLVNAGRKLTPFCRVGSRANSSDRRNTARNMRLLRR